MRQSPEVPDFAATLKRWRLERDLTQRGLGLPASTVAEWERGSRRPRNAAQIVRLAQALSLPVEEVYQALGLTPPVPSEDAPANLEDLFRKTREALLRAYRQGDTAAMAACQERLRELGPKIPERVAAEFLAGHAVDPMAIVDLGGMLFHVDQWPAAVLALEGALKVVPEASPLRSRVESNLGMIYAALGEFEAALAHDQAYLALASEQNDGWLSVLAHGQWVEHQLQNNPLDPELPRHLDALTRWNASGIRTDPFIEVWERLSRAQVAMASGEEREAGGFIESVREQLRTLPELASEALSVALVSARHGRLYHSPAAALDQLRQSLQDFGRGRPLAERLLVQQELCRLAQAADLAEARLWQLTLLSTYGALGAGAWMRRLAEEWGIAVEEDMMLATGAGMVPRTSPR